MVYCVMPPSVAGRVRRTLERGAERSETVTLVVERRARDRRAGPDRRKRRLSVPQAVERRRIVYGSGRRVAERRAVLVPVRPPADLPRSLRQHAGELSFLEALDLPAHFRDDVDAVRAVVRYQAGQAEIEELYGRWFDPLYTYLRVTSERGADVEAQVATVLTEALRLLRRTAPAPEQLRPWLFALAFDVACADPPPGSRANGHAARSAASDAARDEEDLLTWLSDDDLLLLVERRPRRERHALVLRYFAGLSFNEIGEIMRISAAEAAGLHRAAVDSLDATLAAVTRSPRVQDRHPMGRLVHQTPVLHRRRRALLAV